jgi:hypothetical protein
MTMTALELSFQFPIKREGASPVVGAAASVAAGVSAGAAEREGLRVHVCAWPKIETNRGFQEETNACEGNKSVGVQFFG